MFHLALECNCLRVNNRKPIPQYFVPFFYLFSKFHLKYFSTFSLISRHFFIYTIKIRYKNFRTSVNLCSYSDNLLFCIIHMPLNADNLYLILLSSITSSLISLLYIVLFTFLPVKIFLTDFISISKVNIIK